MADSFQLLRLDYQSQRDALIQRIQARYPGVWNDFLTGSFGVVILDAMAWTMTTFAYTVNKLAGENFIPTLTRRESVVRLGNLTGYTLANPAPATVLCQATLSSAATQPVTVVAGTPVKTATQPVLTFEVAQDYVIQVGQTKPSRVVAVFDPTATGPLTISALLSLTTGQAFADVLDPAIDLRPLIQGGQTLAIHAQPDTLVTAVTVGAEPGTFNRLVLAGAWPGPTNYYVGQVLERRVAMLEGQTRTEIFSGNGGALACRLANGPVIDATTGVVVDATAWAPVIYLAGQDGHARVFQVRTLPGGVTVVLFGDGAIGAAPPTNSRVTITYRTGGGAVGNVAAGAINATVLGRLDSGATASVRLISLYAGQGGADAETVETARRQIPASTRAGDRAVTLADYQVLAATWKGGLGQVAYARAEANVSGGYSEKNVVTVTAWISGSAGLTPVREPARSALQAYLQGRACGTDYVAMADGTVEPFPLAIRAQVAAGYSVDDTEASILAAVSALVAADEPGAPVNYAALVGAVDATPGVGLSQVAVPASDVAPSSATAVFATPTATSSYQIELVSVGGGQFTAVLPFIPRYAWTLAFTLAGTRLAVSPDVESGFARLTGGSLSTVKTSRVNLATGQVTLFAVGAVARFFVELTSVQGYNQLRQVDVFVSYTGDSSVSKRREVRQALRAWGAGLSVGQTVFASGGTGTSMTDVVVAQSGVQPATVVVTLGAPGGATRDDPVSAQLPVLRKVVVNGYVD